MVLFTLSIEEDAKASMAITKSGLMLSIIPLIISLDSIPVVPITPGVKALTFLYPSSFNAPNSDIDIPSSLAAT